MSLNVEGVEDAEAAIVPWLTERVKDSQILRQQEIAVLLAQVIEEREIPIFSDRFDPEKDIVTSFVRELLGSAAEACNRQPGRNRFVVRLKGDSRSKRFTLHAMNVGEEAAAAPLSDPFGFVQAASEGEDRAVWARFAAAVLSNTASFTSAPPAEDKPKKPGTSRAFNKISPEAVVGYAARVADEMLRAYRARWKK